MSNNHPAQRHSPVRSFVIRGGRLTRSQQQALEKLLPKFGIPFNNEALDLSAYFDSERPLTVEIGFGMGASLIEMAKTQPEQNFIGIEVHPPGVGRILLDIKNAGLSNLRVVQHDAQEVMQQGFADNSLDRILILFPDPWPKKKHHKRRLVQADFMTLLTDKLKPGGHLHLATDWEPYAQQMLSVLDQIPSLQNCNGSGCFWENPQRPRTKFEQRGIRLGHGVWDLLYEKQPAESC